MALNGEWFTEIDPDGGTAVSARLVGPLLTDASREPEIQILQSEACGRLLVLDGRLVLAESDGFIYHEMLVHPALYSHPAPRSVAVLGGEHGGALHELVKHRELERIVVVGTDPRVQQACAAHFPELDAAGEDPRVRYESGTWEAWLDAAAPGSLDVILVDAPRAIDITPSLFGQASRVLGGQGLLVQPSGSPLVDAARPVRAMHDAMRAAGFLDVLTLHFPQGLYPGGWWTLTTACKDMPIMFSREEDAEHPGFETRYYNAAMHRTSTATPQFLHACLMG
jgi:spermidine synthase